MELDCAVLVNAVGLHAPDLARTIRGIPPETIPRAYFCKGSYYSLTVRAPFRRLIYPVPEAAGLGVHLTLDLGGQARFGRTYAGEPERLVTDLAEDEAIAAADTLLLTIPNQLGVDYNAHLLDSVLRHLAPGLGWR